MRVNEDNPLGSEKIVRLLHDFALPSIIAMLVGALYNIVDQFFIGRSVGMYGNAATNVALPLTTVCTALGLLFGVGGASNFNLKMGAGKREEAAKYIGNSITLLVGSGVALALFVLVFLKPLMIAFGATDIVLKYALIFAGINCLGFPFLILGTGGSTLVRADGSPKYSMTCMLTGAFINLILNPLFVFVMGWGIAGSASATVIGQVISGLMVAGYLRKFKTVPLGKSDLLLTWQRSKMISALGAASCFNQFAIMVV
nr:MATE family efflux transporter [uncultured Phascolarctobacterium sp.]